MRILWLVLVGVAGGVLGGMGFGGGTLLIPMLTLCLGVPYRTAAWVNLVAFLPTAIAALIFHCKNKMVVWRMAGQILLFASLGLLAGIFAVGKVSEQLTRLIFGWFLITVGSCSIFVVLLGCFKRKTKM